MAINRNSWTMCFPCGLSVLSESGLGSRLLAMDLTIFQSIVNKYIFKGLVKHTPRAIAWDIPNLGTFLAHRGLKWSDVQIFPPLYILAVFPSNSGKVISGAVVGYVTGIYAYRWLRNQVGLNYSSLLTSNSTSNSYRSNSWMYHTFPNHLVPSLFESNLNQSLSFFLFCSTYYWGRNWLIRAIYPLVWLQQKLTFIKDINSSFNRDGHNSLSLGPAFVFISGKPDRDFFVASSTMIGVLVN